MRIICIVSGMFLEEHFELRPCQPPLPSLTLLLSNSVSCPDDEQQYRPTWQFWAKYVLHHPSVDLDVDVDPHHQFSHLED